MTPEPYLVWQSRLLAIAVFAAGLLRLTVLAVAVMALTLAVWGALRAPYVQRRKAWKLPPQPAPRDPALAQDPLPEPALAERERLDRRLDRLVVVILVAGVLGVAAGYAIGLEGERPVPAHTAAIAVALVLGGIFWSSLVDWYWVLPRVSGLLGHRSCREQPEENGPRFSGEEVTRWWLLHRLVSAFAVSVGAGGIGGSIGAGLTSLAGGDPAAAAMVGVVIAVITAGVQAYRGRVIAAFPITLHPSVWVGRSYVDDKHGECFVVDVALENYKVVRKGPARDRQLAHLTDDAVLFLPEKGDGEVPLAEAASRRVGQGRLYCPPDRCDGLSWYCVHNPYAWRKGPPATTKTPASDGTA